MAVGDSSSGRSDVSDPKGKRLFWDLVIGKFLFEAEGIVCCQMFDISKYVFEVDWYSKYYSRSGWLPCPSEMFFWGKNGRMITHEFR